MRNLFASSGYAGSDLLELDSGEQLNLKELPAFLRVLLTTDGTVTKILESYFWEPVNVNRLAQCRTVLAKPSASLALPRESEVIERRVSLSGADSERLYALARSFVNPAVLPSSLVQELEADRVGIGELLRETGLETYRELISIGRDSMHINRVYRIMSGGKPCMEICEQFPLELYSRC
ncbi:chorismate--pyruvate lyase family protein [Agaribacterium haliotis]|uniref:chorismate--pyruvate lyase family protein n=1 Tax=Agaribacterium haliotis TaxID=2013869 RepID=UPI000BB534A2|nr:chorismate pyruvate-lyase family protein [Agaribacterium haliotis]